MAGLGFLSSGFVGKGGQLLEFGVAARPESELPLLRV